MPAIRYVTPCTEEQRKAAPQYVACTACLLCMHACMHACMYLPGCARSPLIMPRPAVMQHKEHACHKACSVAAACMYGVRIHCTKVELASRLHGVFVYQEHSCGSSILAAVALRESAVCPVLCRLRQARLVLLLLHREGLKRANCSSQYCKNLFSLQRIHSECFQQQSAIYIYPTRVYCMPVLHNMHSICLDKQLHLYVQQPLLVRKYACHSSPYAHACSLHSRI